MYPYLGIIVQHGDGLRPSNHRSIDSPSQIIPFSVPYQLSKESGCYSVEIVGRESAANDIKD